MQQHVHNLWFAPILDHAHEVLGAERTAEVLHSQGIDEATLRDSSGWSSLDLTERLSEAFVEASGDPDFIAKCSRRFVLGHYLGPLKTLLGILGSPKEMFGSFPTRGARWGKFGTWEVHDLDEDRATMSFTSDIERSEQICIGRVSQLRWAVAGIFGLDPAEVHHPECMNRGDSRCLYEIRWKPAERGLWQNRLGVALAGAILGLAGGWALHPSLLVASVVSVLLATLSVALLDHRRRGATIRQTQDLLFEQDITVRETLRSNEQRYRDLAEAKAGVDAEVARQTLELRQTGAELERALDEVREADELKTRFFANVSHELRTPLQLILAPLDALLAGETPTGGTDRAFRAMQHSARRLHTLIDQLLDLARADAGAESLSRAPLDPRSLLDGIREQFGALAESRRVTLRTESRGEPFVAHIDRHWIES
ncbi:MAG: histidine kinase dimerization/phospho-acceptor domain-containing protein, partial [Myxococcota bacterium]